jgi:hypothetical protein
MVMATIIFEDFAQKCLRLSQMSQHLGGSPGKGEARRLFSMGLQGCRGASFFAGPRSAFWIYRIRFLSNESPLD